MGEYQLCRGKKAGHPFYIERIDSSIYTIEELCFYFEHNLCLVDESILNERLCRWLEEELGLGRLGRRLMERMGAGETTGNLVLLVFKDTGYLQPAECRSIQEQFARMELQPQDIRKKTQADFLANHGMYSGAIGMYRQILKEKSDGRMGIQFYAGILNNMAAVYARMFLFREAAECLWNSYEMVRSNAVYHRYLAILPYFLSEEAYKQRLAEWKVPKAQIENIEKEKEAAAASLHTRPLFQEAGREELAAFLEQEKKKYHKSRK